MTLEVVYCRDVVRIHDAGAHETAEYLRDEVDRETPPGKLAVEAVAECYGGIEVGARVAGNIYA